MKPFELESIATLIRRADHRLNKKLKTDYLGYNMFSNNGGPAVSQHIPHFHQHIFFRFKSESAAPFKLLNEDRKENLSAQKRNEAQQFYIALLSE